jgi:hypothetical protein
MHFANGREAKLGDLVVGYGYNTTQPILGASPDTRPESKKLAGTLVKATPGSDRCNAEIEWVEVVELTSASATATNPMQFSHIPRPRMAIGEPRLYQSPTGAVQAHFTCRDYTHVGALLHVEDAILLVADSGHLKPVVAPESGLVGRTVDLDAPLAT